MEKKFKIITTIFILVFLILLGLNLSKPKVNIDLVCFDNNCFKVEVVSTSKDMEKGLMFRGYLDRGSGMLFVFEDVGNYPFWMKNTLIPLDIIWINENYEVVFIKENAMPCLKDECPTINPNIEAKYVLEINGGLVKEMDIKVGNKVSFSGPAGTPVVPQDGG